MQPYLESLSSYTDGAPPWTPTNRGHGITSRPLKYDPEVSPRESKGLRTDHLLTDINNQEIHTYIMHRNFLPTPIANPHLPHVEPIPTRCYQPWEKCLPLIPILWHWITNHQYIHRCSCQICDHIYIQPLMYNPHKIMPNSPFTTCKPPLIIYTQSHHAIIQ